MRRVLLYVPLYRDIPQARESWFIQSSHDAWVDVFIMRYNPFPDKGVYDNLAVKDKIARKMFLAGGYDFFFHVEDDIILPKYALHLLLQENVPLISGLYRCRPETGGTYRMAERILDIEGPQDADDRPLELRDIKNWGNIIECTQAGNGCLLIRKDVMTELEGVMGLDWKIYERLSPEYIKVLCHSGVICGHVDETGEIIGVKTHGNLPPYRLFDCSPEPSVPR